MPIDPAHYTTILRFWRSVETFTLPDLPAEKRTDHVTLLRPGRPLPWEPGELPAPKEAKQWRHTLYFHIVPKETVIRLLAHLTGSDDFRESVGGETCLSALTLDSSGKPTVRTYSPASFIYGIKAIRDKHNPEILTDWLTTAQRDYRFRFGLVTGPPSDSEPTAPPAVTWTHLYKELDHLGRLALADLATSTPIRCVSQQVAATATPEAPFLNSYYLHDLDNLIRHPMDISPPLQTFLSPQPPIPNRIHLLEPKVLVKRIGSPPPPARWPSNPNQHLYTAQYAALSIALSHPTHPPTHPTPHHPNPPTHPAPHHPNPPTHPTPHHPDPPCALLGINGPPGTGKTTLLREIIATVITNRARRLLSTDPDRLFQQIRLKLSDRAGYYRPEPGIIDSDGIVVSGNNNTAIENITRQLPLTANIDLQTFPDAQYFSAFASNILGQPCWGMIGADLGRLQKRNDFIDKFWFHQAGFGKWLRQQYEDHAKARSNADNLASTATRLRSLLSEYDTAISSLPPPDFDGLSHEEIHRATPYASEKLNTLRSRIFLNSLALHEWTIRYNARYVYQNLGSFVDMEKGKWRENIDGDIAGHLWNTFFFCIPVVSVTLASFQRQFHLLRQGSIGWLLLDEAGQASPPAVCGALWRCRRCILIGDTRQIPPIVNIPDTLTRLLQDRYGIADDDWSPSKHSAQYLADRVTVTGAYIRRSDNDQIWTGIPLRAHRRCLEPMFSIANTIAYDGQMVQATPGAANNNSSLIPTGWFHIPGEDILDGHALTEEIQFLGDLLKRLYLYPNPIFIISPFRSIADLCRLRYESPRIKCGTIHTVQGKEADIVILILGTAPGNKKARNWAASGPNILNVAITRARLRLYVIGNRDTWSAHRYFDHLAATLPDRPHGRLIFPSTS